MLSDPTSRAYGLSVDGHLFRSTLRSFRSIRRRAGRCVWNYLPDLALPLYDIPPIPPATIMFPAILRRISVRCRYRGDKRGRLAGTKGWIRKERDCGASENCAETRPSFPWSSDGRGPRAFIMLVRRSGHAPPKTLVAIETIAIHYSKPGRENGILSCSFRVN